MSSYRVVVGFHAFARDYKRDDILADGDLSCWQPDEDREAAVEDLLAKGKIEALAVADPEAAYPSTWGGAKKPAKTTISD